MKMTKFLSHTTLQTARKLTLTACFLICGWFVYAHVNERSYFEVQAKVVKCYPNPAISFVNFEFPDNVLLKNYTLQIYSFSGKKMSESTVTTAKIVVSLNNDFYRGVYIYQLRDKAGKIMETGKFQVVR